MLAASGTTSCRRSCSVNDEHGSNGVTVTVWRVQNEAQFSFKDTVECLEVNIVSLAADGFLRNLPQIYSIEKIDSRITPLARTLQQNRDPTGKPARSIWQRMTAGAVFRPYDLASVIGRQQ